MSLPENVLLALQDPVSSVLFDNAVILDPCGHSFSRETVQQILTSSELRLCPTCRSFIAKYIPNYSLRSIVEAISKLSLPDLSNVTKSIADEKYNLSAPFPGKPGKFECIQKWHVWQPCRDSLLCRYMEFRSITPNSLLEKVVICGYSDDTMQITLTANASNKSEDRFWEFVKDAGFPYDPCSTFFATTSVQQRWVLFVLTQHNEVPQLQFSMITKMVECKSWKNVEKNYDLFEESMSTSLLSDQATNCAYCFGANAAKRCGRCNQVRYCNRTCQTAAWGKHKATCVAKA